MTLRLLAVAALIAQVSPMPAMPQQLPIPGRWIDYTAPPGANYDKANIRVWMPQDAGPLRAIVVLVPGSNGDGRASAGGDEVWKAFAVKHHAALVGCQFTDKPHEQGFIEDYVDVSKGTGQAFLDGLMAIAGSSAHPELATAPLLLWGMSAGGEFNYEFTAWKPERVIAFVVNKGNIYYTALAPRAARSVPGILFVGGKDLEFRTSTITGLFAVNRRAGALWALANEPNAGHVVGRSRDVAIAFFEDMLEQRLPPGGDAASGPVTLRPLNEKSGYFGDLKTGAFQPVAGAAAPTSPVAWLPTERVARMWQAMVTDKPFER